MMHQQVLIRYLYIVEQQTLYLILGLMLLLLDLEVFSDGLLMEALLGNRIIVLILVL